MIVENNHTVIDGNDLRRFGTITLLFETEAERRQAEVFIEALAKYAERNEFYRDNWRRMGWRGMLVRVRERAERLWDSLWDAGVPSWADFPRSGETLHEKQLDDAIDLINFAGFLVRAVRAGNRDGNWWSQPS